MAKEAAIAVTALLLAVVAGLIGFLPFLATQFTGSPNIGEWDRSQFIGAGLMLLVYFAAALGIGYAFPRYWFLAVPVAWLAVLGTATNAAPPDAAPGVIVNESIRSRWRRFSYCRWRSRSVAHSWEEIGGPRLGRRARLKRRTECLARPAPVTW